MREPVIITCAHCGSSHRTTAKDMVTVRCQTCRKGMRVKRPGHDHAEPNCVPAGPEPLKVPKKAGKGSGKKRSGRELALRPHNPPALRIQPEPEPESELEPESWPTADAVAKLAEMKDKALESYRVMRGLPVNAPYSFQPRPLRRTITTQRAIPARTVNHFGMIAGSRRILPAFDVPPNATPSIMRVCNICQEWQDRGRNGLYRQAIIRVEATSGMTIFQLDLCHGHANQLAREARPGVQIWITERYA